MGEAAELRSLLITLFKSVSSTKRRREFSLLFIKEKFYVCNRPTMDPKIILILVSLVAISQGLRCYRGDLRLSTWRCSRGEDVCVSEYSNRYGISHLGCRNFRTFNSKNNNALKRNGCVWYQYSKYCTCSTDKCTG